MDPQKASTLIIPKKNSIIYLSGMSPTKRQINISFTQAVDVELQRNVSPNSKPRHLVHVFKNPLLKLLASPYKTLYEGQLIFQLIKDFSFFKNFFNDNHLIQDEESLNLLCSKMQLETFSKGHSIFKEGQESNNKMYVIASGKVAVMMKNPFSFGSPSPQISKSPTPSILPINKSPNSQQSQSPKNTFFSSPINAQTQSPNNNLTALARNNGQQGYKLNLVQIDQDNIEQIIGRYGQKINELQVGQQFGERALLAESQKQATRSASCVAITEVYLITLRRDDFLEVIKQFRKDSSVKKEILMQAIPKFDTIVSQQIVENLMYSFKEETYQRDHYITKENISSDYVYVVQSGEVAIIKNYQGHSVIIATVDEIGHGLLGEESLFNVNGMHLYSCVVMSQEAKVLKIAQSSFQLRSPMYCIEGIKNILQTKIEFRENSYKRIVESQLIHQFSEDKNSTNKKDELKQMSSLFLNNSQQNCNQSQIRQLMIKKILRDQNQNSGTQKRAIKLVQESDIYKQNPIIEKVLNQLDTVSPNREETNDIKNRLLDLNIINPFKVTIKSETQVQLNDFIDLEEVTNKVTSKICGKSQEYLSNGLDLYPKQIKQQMRFKLIQQGRLKIPKPYSQIDNNKIIQIFKTGQEKKKERYQKKQNKYQFLIKNHTMTQLTIPDDLIRIQTEIFKENNTILSSDTQEIQQFYSNPIPSKNQYNNKSITPATGFFLTERSSQFLTFERYKNQASQNTLESQTRVQTSTSRQRTSLKGFQCPQRIHSAIKTNTSNQYNSSSNLNINEYSSLRIGSSTDENLQQNIGHLISTFKVSRSKKK